MEAEAVQSKENVGRSEEDVASSNTSVVADISTTENESNCTTLVESPSRHVGADHTYNSNSDCITIELKNGWCKKIVRKLHGKQAGRSDIYFLSPLGGRFRTRSEILTHCVQHGLPVDLDEFGLSHTSRGRPPSKIKRTTDKSFIGNIPQITITSASDTEDGTTAKTSPTINDNSMTSLPSESDGSVRREAVAVPPSLHAKGDHTYTTGMQSLHSELKELPPGWRREVHERKNGKSAGKTDVYIFGYVTGEDLSPDN